MKSKVLRVLNIKSVIFLIAIFSFLFFTQEVFAQLPPCVIQDDGWNRETCYRELTYTTGAPVIVLTECLYNIQNGSSPVCPTSEGEDNLTWSSACPSGCEGEYEIICPVTVPIGPGEVCNVNGEGTCKLCGKAVDESGLVGYGERAFNIDFAAPETTIQCNGATCLADWYNAADSDVTVTLDCYDCASPGVDCSGCDETYYCVDQANTCSPTNIYNPSLPPSVTTEGTNYVWFLRYYSTDIAGNVEQPVNSKTIKLDKNDLSGTLTIDPMKVLINETFTVSVDSQDSLSGVNYIYLYRENSQIDSYSCGGLNSCSNPWNLFEPAEGSYTYQALIYDVAGNSIFTNTEDVTITASDTTSPTVWVSGAPADWQNTDAQASVGCDDGAEGSGCDTGSYRLKTYTSSGSCSTNYSDYTLTSPQTISSHLWVCAAAKDLVGNEGFSPTRVEFKVDKEDPVVTSFTADRTLLNIANPTVTFSWAATDSGGSHLKQVELWRRIVGESWPANPIDTLAASGDSDSGIFIDSPTVDGDYEYGLHALDNAGNLGAEPATIIITVDKTAPATIISPDGKDWGNSDVDFTLSCDDGTGSGCQTTQYKVIEQSQTCDTADLITGTSGTVTCPEGQTCQKKVCFRSIDNLGNEETINTSEELFKIDKESPLVGAISPTACQVNVSTTFSADVSDNIEVINCWLYIVGGEYGVWPGTNDGEMSLSASPCSSCTSSKDHTFNSTGTYSLYALCRDEAGNYTSGPPVTVTVTEFGPLICNINVPGSGIVNQPIAIDVSDSEGAITEVRFASDDDLDTNPPSDDSGNWSPDVLDHTPQYYDWNIPEGDWEDATSKIMKWSFAATGTYEVWAEISDGSETASCYNTITIFECWPSWETRPCSSGYDCEHIQTCTSEGTWPTICGLTDECSPGDSQICDTEGIKTCTDICIWGTCIFPPPPNGNGVECPWPPDNPPCGICQHPVCDAATNYEWECQPDPDAVGTDCGDCLMCDDGGNCNIPLCLGTPENCECIAGSPDSCKDCSEYGTECGYDKGPCYCGPYEYPIWSCDEEKCQCYCQYDETGEICPREEPGGCEYYEPIVNLSPDYKEGAAGDRLTYAVSVINQDEGVECEPSDFTLSTGGICGSWNCYLDSPTLTIAPQGSQATKLHVRSPSDPPASKGYYPILVMAFNQTSGLLGTDEATYRVLNNPPSAKSLSVNTEVMCPPPATYPFVELSWVFDDIDGDSQSAYQVQVDDDSDFSSIENDSGQVFSGSPAYSPHTLSFNTTYFWQVKVWDSEEASSDWIEGPSFTTPLHAAPWPDFEPSPTRVHLNEVVTFEDNSICYIAPNNSAVSCDSPSSTSSYEWNFDYNIETEEFTVDSNTEGSTTKKYSKLGKYYVKLRITDTVWPTGETKTCYSDTKEVIVTKPLPEWMEIPPF